MKMPVRIAVSCLVLWHGIMAGVPHHHADTAVPQERLACSASHPLSQESHLHDRGETLESHPCLACILGSVIASTPSPASAARVPEHPAVAAGGLPDFRSHHRVLLPLHRGPPAIA